MNTLKLNNTSPLVVADSTPRSMASKSGQGGFSVSLRQAVNLFTRAFRPVLGYFFESTGTPRMLVVTP